MSTLQFLDSVFRDFRYAASALRKSPGFTATAVLTLALGVGANVAIFSLIDTVLLGDLPFRQPDRIVAIYEDSRPLGGPGYLEPSPASFLVWRSGNQQQSGPFEDIAAMNGFDSYNITGQGKPERLAGIAVTGNLFPLIGVNPLMGRTLLPEDDKPDAPKVAVLARDFGAGALGATPHYWAGTSA
jgi:hypothetical protein